ncbi:MAG: hypothetical protein RLZZ453_177 [Chlamydiota bacterium]|jgi:hypothetical protein
MSKEEVHDLIQQTLVYAKSLSSTSFFDKPQEKPTPSPAIKPIAKTNDIKKTLEGLVPSLKLKETIPDDTEGKKKAMLWKEKVVGADVLLLALSQDEPTLDLLKSLAKAIDTRLAKAKILPGERLEKEKQWDLFFAANPCKLIIVSCLKNRYPELEKHLHTAPILILEDPLVYKQLEKKAELWKTLCKKL